MYVEVKFVCHTCEKVGGILVELEERRSESSCGCCSGSGTGEYYVTKPCWPNKYPEGWVAEDCCGECA